MSELPTLRDLFTGETGRNGQWVVVNVQTFIGWPMEVTKMQFKNRPIFLLPYTVNAEKKPDTFPCAALRLAEGERFEDGQIILSQFLSSLCWVEGTPIRIEYWSGGNLPRPMGGYSGTPSTTRRFYQPYIPEAPNPQARLALAFYREGLALNHVAYQCLSFFKVLNIFLRTAREQKDWINAESGKIENHEARMRLAAIAATGAADIGGYLYASSRCAVAHAGGEPTADPENPYDLHRLHDDLPLVKAFAELAIEEQFKIKSTHDI